MRGHIRKRGNKYSIVIDIGRDHLGKRKQKWFSGFDKKKAAEKELPKLIQQLELGEIVDSENITFADYMEKWLDRKKKNVIWHLSPLRSIFKKSYYSSTREMEN